MKKLSFFHTPFFCCPYLGSVGRMEDYINMENDFLSLIKTRRSVRPIKRNLYLLRL